MKKQFLYGLLVVILPGVFSAVNAGEVIETSKEWQSKKHRRSDNMLGTAVWEKYSDEVAELRKLRKEDPEAFKIKSKEFHAKIGKEIKAEREKFKKLVMQYHKNKDSKICEAIRKYISEAYERRLNATAKRLAEQRRRLEKAEKKLAENKAKKEERINKKLKIILRDPKLNW